MAVRRTLTREAWLREVARYIVAGFSGFAADQGLFMLLVNKTGIHYQILTVLTTGVGLVVNYVLCKFWVWKNIVTRSTWFEAAAFLLCTTGGFAITGLGMHILVEWASLAEELSKFLMAVLVFGYNYIVRKTVVFRAKR